MGIRDWDELDDPYALVAALLAGARSVAVDNHMWAEKVLALRDAMPGAEQVLAGPVISHLRMRKDPDEVAALVDAGAAIDRVHAACPSCCDPAGPSGRWGRDIADLILADGHVRVDFVIVGSGPNGASPHHEVSDRVIERGDVVVVDIGGTMPDGYCSDCTRTYAVGEPPADFSRSTPCCRTAQRAAVEHARAGVTCESVDAAARDVLVEAGLGDLFIHRTGPRHRAGDARGSLHRGRQHARARRGHGVQHRARLLRRGPYGARIEDIVIATADGVIVANQQPRDLVVA